MRKSTRIGLFFIVTSAIAAAAAGWLVLREPDTANAPGGLITSVDVGGPFTLTDQTGRQVTERDLLGHFVLLYFGYTYCPDVCPTELGSIAAALDELGDDALAVMPVMITIDPERDTPEVLAQYVPMFHERLIGLTGTAEQIKQVASAYRVFYQRVDDPNYGQYLMDHTSFIYLLDPTGKVVTMLRYGTPPDEIVKIVRQQMRR